MKKYFLLLAVFILFFYLSQSALPLDYKCDSKPNVICAECASACDYIWVCPGDSEPCNPTCPTGTVFVDDGAFIIGSIYCKNLVCGDAGVASGNTCVQQSSLDSSCVNVAPKTYGWTDNTVPFSCTCYDTPSATINQYTKKADGTVCTKDGKPSTCKTGICQTPVCSCDSGATPCGSCSAISSGQFCEDVGGAGKLKPSLKCPLCAKTDYAGRPTGTGSHPKSPEICYDTVVNGKYTKYYAENCKSTGSVNEYVCIDTDSNGQTDKCALETVACSSGDSCFRKTYEVDLLTGEGKKKFDFGYCDRLPIPPTEGASPPPDLTACDPGNPPYQKDGKANCAKCGCPPSEYPGSTVTCNAGTGLCSYVAPPGLTGEPPDCKLTTPEAEYNITYTMRTLYFLSGKSAGGFSGYNWSLSNIKWQADSGIQSGASAPSYSSPAILLNNTDTYMIVGKGDGGFSGFNWTGAGWASYAGAVSGLTDIGDNSKPSIFYKDDRWHMIAGKADGLLSAFSLTTTGWVTNSTLITGLTDVGSNSAPAVFFMAGTAFLIAGNDTGKFTGFNWTGTAWQSDSNITGGLSSAGSYSSPYVFYKDKTLYLITGKGDGWFAGYNWSGSAWQTDTNITGGLADAGDYSAPAIFQIDSSYTKTYKYTTRFFMHGMQEYPNAGSQCFQNKTEITIPEGHACLVNISANTTHGWGVRLKTTIYSGKTLQQDPYNTCGYIGEDLYGSCTPTGFGHTPICPTYQLPALQAGTYEFGIVSSTGVANGKVSKGCAYITQCSDCTNPYANYYCDLCTNDRCKDGIQNCGETGVDCGGPCQSGKETDNSYVPTISYLEPQGLWGTKLYTEYKGLNCVDGIDNNNDCLIDCADPDCSDSILCSLNEPPMVEIKGTPVEPCKSEIETNKHPAAKDGKWNMSKQIDCSAYPEIKCTPTIAEYKCKESSYGYKVYESDPGNCPGSDLENKTKAKADYKIKTAPMIADTAWVCGYAEDLSGNANVSAPVKFEVNKTFEVKIGNGKAYQFDGKAVPNSEVNVYLCQSGTYYCNQDADYLAKASGKTDLNGKFNLEMKIRLERGTRYKVGLQTEKGYAETGFIA